MLNTPTFHLQEEADYYERASYTWSSDSVRCINTVSPHTRKCYLYMQECGNFKTTFPYYTERSHLPSYLILYTLSGIGFLNYGRKKYELTPETCFYIDCMKPHRYEALPNRNWDFLWLHFYGINAPGYYEDFSSLAIPVLKIRNTFSIESTLRRILSLHQKKTVYTEVLTANLITSIITELMIQKQLDCDSSSPLPDYIQNTISYIQSHYTDSLTLNEIASQMNVSKYHLSREFTRHIGTSINQYIINCRITYAKELLRESSLSVEEIALRSGVNYASHFISLFKDREGITPLEYRKQWDGSIQ